MGTEPHFVCVKSRGQNICVEFLLTEGERRDVSSYPNVALIGGQRSTAARMCFERDSATHTHSPKHTSTHPAQSHALKTKNTQLISKNKGLT